LVAVYEPGTLTVDQNGDLQGIPGSCISRYEYDALNRRIQTIEHPGKVIEHNTMHVYGGGAQVLAEYDVTEGEAGPLARWFVHGESFPDPLVMVDLTAAGDQPAGISEYLYYHKDALGSVGALANETGEVVERYVYDPYGNTTVLRADGTSGLPAMAESYYFDADFDGLITLVDDGHFNTCMTQTPTSLECVLIHDVNGDDVVDVIDQGVYTDFVTQYGLDTPAPPEWLQESRSKLDFNGDNALDLHDFQRFEVCFDAPSLFCLHAFDIDGDGSITLDDEYAPFAPAMSGPGSTVAVSDAGSRFDNPFLWTGQRYEPATGLYHFLYRSYDPGLGRWLQKDRRGSLRVSPGTQAALPTDTGVLAALDPANAAAEYHEALNLYVYGVSSPVRFIDPEGLSVNDVLVERDWDTIYESILGNRRAYLGAQGAATFGSFWGANVALMPEAAMKAGGLSEGMSDFADFYAEQMMWLPVDLAMAGLGAAGGSLITVGSVAQDARAVGKTTKLFTYSKRAGKLAHNVRRVKGLCLAEGTPILTRSGLMPIEDIRQGDEVIAWNFDTEETVVRSVTVTYQRWAQELIDVGLGEGLHLSVTPSHLVWTREFGWVEAASLAIGMHLKAQNGDLVSVASLGSRAVLEKVYDLGVQDAHCYFAGTNAVLVHNASYEDYASPGHAINRALEWLRERGFTQLTTIREYKYGGVGMTTADGKAGYRIDYDVPNGCHVNVFTNKEHGPHLRFPGSKKTHTHLIRRLFCR
jgi:RHS repeat-associated protein